MQRGGPSRSGFFTRTPPPRATSRDHPSQASTRRGRERAARDRWVPRTRRCRLKSLSESPSAWCVYRPEAEPRSAANVREHTRDVFVEWVLVARLLLWFPVASARNRLETSGRAEPFSQCGADSRARTADSPHVRISCLQCEARRPNHAEWHPPSPLCSSYQLARTRSEFRACSCASRLEQSRHVIFDRVFGYAELGRDLFVTKTT